MYTNDEYHWLACVDADCPETAGNAPHAWDAGVITISPDEGDGIMTYTCTACGMTRSESVTMLPHAHTFASAWSHDESGHWLRLLASTLMKKPTMTRIHGTMAFKP